MQQTRRLLSILALVLFSVVSQAQSTPLMIGQVIDLSGPNADFGRDYSLGAKVYFDYTNSTGGINGRRIIYRSSDSAGSASSGLAAAQNLVSEGASVLFGVSGDAVIDAIVRDGSIRNSGVSLFAGISGNPPESSKDSFIYLRAGTAQEIEAMVAHLAPLGIRNISLASTSEFSQEAGNALESAARRFGVKIMARLRFNIAGEGPGLAAQNIARDKPQAVIVAADTLAVGQFFKRYRTLDPGAFLCATSQVNVRTLIGIMGLSAAHGLILSQVVPDPTSISELTREHRKLMERLADEPASHATLEGFVAAKTLVRSLQHNRKTGRTALLQGLQKEGHFDLGGYDLNFSKGARGSNFVELTVVGRNGQLLR